MHKGTKKTLIITGAVVGGLLIIVIAAGAFLVSTQTGLEFILARAPDKIQVQSVKGSLLGPFTLRGVTLHTDSAKVTMDRLTAHWSPSALFSGTLHIDRLQLVDVQVWRHPSEKKTKPASWPPQLKPPIAVNIESLELDGAVIHGASGGSPFIIKTARLAGTFNDQRLHLQKLQAHGPRFDLSGHAALQPDGDYPLDGKLDFALRMPDYAPAKGSLKLGGSLRDLALSLAIAPPYNTRADVKAHALTKPIELNARLKVEALKLQTVHGAWPAVKVSATTRADGSMQDLAYKGNSVLKGDTLGRINIALDGGYAKHVAHIKRLDITRPDSPMRLHAEGDADVSGAAPKLALQFRWRALAWPLAGPPTVTLPQGQARINGTPKRLDARFQTALGKQGQIEGSARRRDDRFQVHANWKQLRWPGGGGKVASPKGTLAFAGTLSDYQIKIDASMSAPKQTNGHLIVKAAGNRDAIRISRIDLKALQGEVTGQARAQWRPALAGKVALSGQGINPGLLVSGWPGHLGIDLKAKGARHNDQLRAHIGTFKISGKLRGYDVALDLAADYRDATLALHQLTLDSGPTHLSARGQVGKTLDLQWQLTSPDLASLYPHAQGSLKGNGKVNGPRKRPHVVATLRGENIKMRLKDQRYAFDQLNLDANVDPGGDTRSHIDIKLAGGEAGKITIKSVALQGAGTPADHHIKLDAQTSKGSVQFAADGGLADQRWRFTLQKATLAYPELAPWQLVEPTRGFVARDAFALSNTCWTTTGGNGGARACVKATRKNARLSGAFNLHALPFAYFAALTPPTFDVTGSLSAEGHFSRAANQPLPTLHLVMHTSEGALLAKAPGEEDAKAPSERIVGFAPSQIKLDLDDSGLQLDGGLQLKGQGEHAGLFVTARVPGGSKPLVKRPLQGKITANVPDIGFIARLRPGVKDISGRIDGTLHIKNTLAAPAIIGKIALEHGAADLPKPGLKLSGVGLVLEGLPDGSIRMTGTAQSGGGKIGIDGTADLTGESKQASINVQGQDFQVLGNALGNAFISPDLNLALKGKMLNVTGDVTVPKARLTISQIPESAVTTSPDQVIVKPGKKQQSVVKQHFRANIHLVLGDDVHFEGFGLKSDITGALNISEEPDERTTGEGSLHLINGEYRAYGQGLVIDEGTLLFAGPITEPAVDIRAVRHPAEDITVGATISGTLKQPKFELFSSPPMTQAETLSWLVLGRPLNDTSDQQGSALSRLALSLGITQSNKVVKNLGESLGLDTFGLQTGPQEAGAASNVYEAALVIGKYLSPRLYVSYGIGLFEPVNTVRLQYTLSSRWKLAAQSSSVASGADLIYTLETE